MKKLVALLFVLPSLLFLNGCNKSEDVTRLATPILSLENETKVVWQTIEDASEFEVDVNGTIYLVNNHYYLVQNYGHYEVKVRALADQMGTLKHSLWSDTLQFDYEDIGLRGLILLDEVRVDLMYGHTYDLKARVMPEASVNFTYLVEDRKIVTILDGILTGVGLGQSKVTVTVNGYQSAVMIVKVIPYINEQASLTIEEGDLHVLSPIVSPKLADDEYLTFTSSDETIAFVGATGVINAIKPGNLTITINSSNGGHKQIDVTINEALPAVVTFIVTTPTPLEAGFSLYLVGSFNEWAIQDSKYIFTPVSGATKQYTLTVTTFEAKMDIEYKYIKGSDSQYAWESYGDSVLANRPIYIPSGPFTINDTISYWQELVG